ncbi:MAG: serine--tRNA ligase [Deltaproteobacteria bacterium]|jgi:seryl-tRNA synthetase|nr:serine--tRNA ligase [Deltaproteobacteria bacterium]
MHDLKFVRENIDLIKDTLKKRKLDPSILDNFTKLDSQRRELLKQSEELRARRNQANDDISKMKTQKEDPSSVILLMKKVSVEIKDLETILTKIEDEEKTLLNNIPNLVEASVPIGDEEANQEVRKWGELRDFGFTPLNHWEIGEKNLFLDFPRAVKIAGARFGVLHGSLSRLNRALINFMLDVHTLEHGYQESWPPALVNSQALYGTGNLPKFYDDLFKLENHDLFLIPTAEVPLTNFFRDEVIEEKKLPIYLTAYTPCFRAEAGAAGKDTRGLIRMHQFDKVELVKFCHPQDSLKELEKLTSDAETILKRLELPYRVVALASGDLGFSSTKTYDLEVYLPGAGVYREISSCSCFTDFQARRANIRFKGKSGKSEYVHTLNGSALAVGRTLAAILENYQNADGTVTVPEVLRPYLGDASLLAAGTF